MNLPCLVEAICNDHTPHLPPNIEDFQIRVHEVVHSYHWSQCGSSCGNLQIYNMTHLRSEEYIQLVSKRLIF